MEPMIILLSGSINAGKAAASKELVRLLPRNFVASGLNVVISSPLSTGDYDTLMRERTPLGVPVHCVMLNPDLAAALTNRGTRGLTEWEPKRIPYHYEAGIDSPPFGTVLDNTRQTPEETARQILEHVKE